MAMLWAIEEKSTPKGWEDEQEIDYAAISSKRAAINTAEAGME